MIDGGLEWHLRRPHLGLGRRQVALLEIAGRAGRDHVDPGRVPTARARQKMIEGEIFARAAILAAELVAQEHVEAGEGGLGRGLYEGLEENHVGTLHLRARPRTAAAVPATVVARPRKAGFVGVWQGHSDSG